MKTRVPVCVFIMFTLLLSLFGSLAEGTGEEVYYIGDYEYCYKEDGTIKITEVLPRFPAEEEVEGYMVDRSEGAMNVIPSFINGVPVTEIGEGALEGLKMLSWTVPGTVKKIGNRAFASSEVETVILEEGVEELGDDPIYANYFEIENQVIPR